MTGFSGSGIPSGLPTIRVPPLSDIKGFPTVKYCPKGLQNPSVEHEGERKAEAIVKFVEEQQ